MQGLKFAEPRELPRCLAMAVSDFRRVGEGIALRDLMDKGFTILKWNTPEQLPDSGDLEAIEAVSRRHILVRVKSAVKPDVPTGLSSDEEGTLKSRASKASAEAWEAKVQLDASLQQGTVLWRRLE